MLRRRRTRKPKRALAAVALLAVAAAGCGDAAATHSVADGGSPVDETVVLLHGLGRSSFSMALLAHRLERAGFRTANLDYPSTEKPIAELVDHLQRELGACCAEATRLHFVTHSMGGVLVRAWIAREGPPRVARVVMLAPPNGGSEIVDHLRETPLLEWALGPAVLELGTDGESTPRRLRESEVDFELGVIAGTRTLNPIGSWMIAGPDDGTVSVESARLEGLERRGAFVVMPVTHTFIMGSSAVAAEVGHFLRHGRFSAEALARDAS